ncbi:hypothetical protein [Aminobacter ciceronei]|uniref:Uncharacterized protein n=1 Tax=Aminobacter ciceronei TaxID=150723 RepID=A0ABR6CG02_9HYPH|nr:hypothetical protein [Aminobacter ciceronei]MBA8910158.1 hypothetical protein [Aminobacter ciceronei]MBA9023930.1 hypothetical protein [Aminobacter ciceronei]
MAIRVRRVGTHLSFNRVVEPEPDMHGLTFHWNTGGPQRSALWVLRCETKSFQEVIAAMLESDRHATLDAIATALKAEGAKTAD